MATRARAKKATSSEGSNSALPLESSGLLAVDPAPQTAKSSAPKRRGRSTKATAPGKVAAIQQALDDAEPNHSTTAPEVSKAKPSKVSKSQTSTRKRKATPAVPTPTEEQSRPSSRDAERIEESITVTVSGPSSPGNTKSVTLLNASTEPLPTQANADEAVQAVTTVPNSVPSFKQKGGKRGVKKAVSKVSKAASKVSTALSKIVSRLSPKRDLSPEWSVPEISPVGAVVLSVGDGAPLETVGVTSYTQPKEAIAPTLTITTHTPTIAHIPSNPTDVIRSQAFAGSEQMSGSTSLNAHPSTQTLYPSIRSQFLSQFATSDSPSETGAFAIPNTLSKSPGYVSPYNAASGPSSNPDVSQSSYQPAPLSAIRPPPATSTQKYQHLRPVPPPVHPSFSTPIIQAVPSILSLLNSVKRPQTTPYQTPYGNPFHPQHPNHEYESLNSSLPKTSPTVNATKELDIEQPQEVDVIQKVPSEPQAYQQKELAPRPEFTSSFMGSVDVQSVIPSQHPNLYNGHLLQPQPYYHTPYNTNFDNGSLPHQNPQQQPKQDDTTPTTMSNATISSTNVNHGNTASSLPQKEYPPILPPPKYVARVPEQTKPVASTADNDVSTLESEALPQNHKHSNNEEPQKLQNPPEKPVTLEVVLPGYHPELHQDRVPYYSGTTTPDMVTDQSEPEEQLVPSNYGDAQSGPSGESKAEASLNPPVPEKPQTKKKNTKRAISAVSDEVADEDSLPAKKRKAKGGKSISVAKEKGVQSSKLPKKKRDQEIAAGLPISKAVPFPSDNTRIPCFYHEDIGNLVFTDDKTELHFIAVGQHPPQVPKLTIPIADIPLDPLTSAKGSLVMALRIRQSLNDGTDGTTIHAFKTGTTDDAYDALVAFRAKIVTARIQVKFQQNNDIDIEEATHQVVKPFACHKCERRFKNKLGVEYHLTKSNTVCNPNFVPDPNKPPRKGGRKKKEVVINEDNENVVRSPKVLRKHKPSKRQGASREPNVVGDALDDGNQRSEDAGMASDTSEDSAVVWLRENATSAGLSDAGSGPRSAKTSGPRIYKALPGEKQFMEMLVDDIATNQLYENNGDVVMSDIGSEGSNPNDMSMEAALQMIIDLVKCNGGLLPGGRALWYAFVGGWLHKFTRSSVLPESKTCYKLLDELCEAGTLKKITYSFMGEKSRELVRTIIATSEYDVESNAHIVDMMKNVIEAAAPGFYIPSNCAPPAHILEALIAIEHRPSANSQPESEGSSADEKDVVQYYDYGGESDISIFEGSPSPASNASEGAEEGRLDEDPVETPAAKKRRRRGITLEPGYVRPKKTEEWKKKHSERLSAWHADRRARGIAPSVVRTEGDEVVIMPLTWARKAALKAKPTPRLDTWDSAPAYMPNHITGAWDQPQVNSAPPTRTRGSHVPKTKTVRLAEPITFMQAENGAWSERPYGHGVKPIFSRPSRMGETTAMQEAYLSKIRSGHRPIVYPQNYKTNNTTAQRNKNGGSSAMEGGSSGSTSVDPEVTSNDPHVPDTPRRRKQTRRPRKASAIAADSNFSGVAGPGDGADSDADAVFEVDQDDEDEDMEDEPPPTRQKRAYRRKNKTLQEQEVQTLNFFEPKKLPPRAPLNPGLESIPSSFGLLKHDTRSARVGSDSFSTYQTVTFVEPQTITRDIDMTEGSWTMGQVSKKRTYDDIRYDPDTSFSVQSLPYEQLRDSGDEVDAAQAMNAPPPVKRRKVTTSTTRPQSAFKTRNMTALPADFAGVLDDPKDSMKWFDTQVAENLGDHSRKRYHSNDRMATEDEARFMLTVVIIRTLTGGVEHVIDWVLVSKVIIGFSINYLTRLWNHLHAKKKALLEKLTIDFQDAFLVGYEKGEILPINYDNLVDYNWHRLIKWTKRKIDTSLVNRLIHLPPTEEAFDNTFITKEIKHTDSEIQDSYFHLTNPMYKRVETISSFQHTLPMIPTPPRPDVIIDELTIARSWVRAAAITPAELWDANAAKEKLNQLGPELVEEALTQLRDAKVVVKRGKKRQLEAGRAYEASDVFSANLKKQIQPKILSEAYLFKQHLDAEFRAGKPCVKVDYMGDQGSYMVMTSLLAAERIRIEGINIPMKPGGLGDENTGYETKKIPKSTYVFQLDMYPTSTYMFDSDNPDVQNFHLFEPPRGSDAGEIPVWISISGDLISDFWKRSLAALSGILALREGIARRELVAVFKPLFEEWELVLLLSWGEAMGLFFKVGDGVDGWGVREWWWVNVGRICTPLKKGKGKEKVVSFAE